MDFAFRVFLVLVFIYGLTAALYGFTEFWSKKPLVRWSFRRKLYFACWMIIALLNCTYALRLTTESETYRFWTGIGFGAQFALMVLVPCGAKIFNTHRGLRLLRNLFFLAMSLLHLAIALA